MLSGRAVLARNGPSAFGRVASGALLHGLVVRPVKLTRTTVKGSRNSHYFSGTLFPAAASAQAGRPAHPRCHRALHLRNVWGCGPDARLQNVLTDRGAPFGRPVGGTLPGGGLFARGSGRDRLRGRAISTRIARQPRQGPPMRPCGGRKPRETR